MSGAGAGGLRHHTRSYGRSQRLNVEVQRELGEAIRLDMTDPRISGLTITSVDVSPDLRNARVRVSSFGTDEQLNLAITVLNKASGRLRKLIGGRLKLRVIPQLAFSGDWALREGDRVHALIKAAVAADHRGGDPDFRSEAGHDDEEEPPAADR